MKTFQRIACLLPLLILSNFLIAATRYWVGTTNWNNTSNWSASSGGAGGAGVPGAGDAVIFDNNGTGSCSIDAAVNIASIAVGPGYTGTITQGANTMAVSGTANFASGTFAGGSANITITNAFTNSGTVFTSTSAILELRDNAAFSGGSFIHNNGTVRFNCTNTATETITGISPTFNTLEFVGLSRSYTISSVGNMVVLSSLNFTGSSFYNLNTGSIDVKGDINVTNTATSCGGDAQININGTGTQNFSGASAIGQGAISKLAINKASGSLNLFNFPAVSNDLSYSAGVINAGTSTFCFTHGTSGTYTITGSFTLANIAFSINSSGVAITIAATLTATGDCTLAGSGNTTINTGTVNVSGNLNLTNTSSAGGGTWTINMVGSGNQSIDGTAITVGQSRLPNITINKPAGTLSFLGNISFYGSVTYLAGAISPGTANIYLVGTLTITGSFNVYNLLVSTSGTVVITIASGSTVTVLNDYTMGNGTLNQIVINTGTIAVAGNIIDNNTFISAGGSATILLNGTGAQNISSVGVINQGAFPAVTVNKSSGTLTLPALITVKSNWTYITGTIDAATNNATVVFASSLTITGSHALNNIIFDAAGSYAMTIAAGTTLTLNGNMGMSGIGNLNINTGTINLKGDLNLSNTATGGGGSATIVINGTANQAVSGILTIYQSSLPSITINKASGTLTLPAMMTERGNWTYTAGAIDVTSNNSTLVFGNTLTITGSHTLNNITFDAAASYTFTTAPGTVITANGNMKMSGANNIFLNTGNINLYGNLLLSNTGAGGGGTSVVSFLSTTNQSISSTLLINQCNLPAVTINKSAGVLTFPAIVTVKGNWTYTAGTLDVTTNNSMVAFNANLSFTGSHALNNVTLEALSNNTFTVNTGTILTVTGMLTTSGPQNLNLNTTVAAATAIQAQGDITLNNTSISSGGQGTILINGTGNQNLTSAVTAGQGRLPYVKIQKASGTLTLGGTISVSRDWTYASGAVDPASSTVVFGGNNLSVGSAGMTFHHVSIIANTASLSGSLTMDGNMTISAGVLAPGANSINIAGNWTNYGTAGFTEATSSVNLNGPALQTISTAGGENFTNLIVNNAGPGIQLLNGAAIATALTMTAGNIDLNGNNLSLGLSTANPGALNYTAGTIINTGTFTRWYKALAIAGNTGLFPMGTSANYRPLFVFTTAAPTTGGTIAVTYADAATNTPVSFADGAATVAVRKDLSWGMTTANGLAGGTYNLQENGTGFGAVGSVADLRLTLNNSTIGTAGINAGTTSNPQINRTGLSLANLTNSFYIGSVNAINSPLPINLVSFHATLTNGQVLLDWTTSGEIDDEYFTVQRSKNALPWESIGQVIGAGTTTASKNYSSSDPHPYPGVSYYRLEQTDLDGKHTYSAVRSVTLAEAASTVRIYPNPASSALTIQSSGTDILRIELFNNEGKKMLIPISDQGNTKVLTVGALATGIYIIKMYHSGFTDTRNILIKK